MIFQSTAVKLLFRFIASIASAIVVISGFLYIMNLGQREKEEDLEEQKEDVVIPPEDDVEENPN
ncbi:MAG: hypothetical protein MJE63_32440 [Proteobacteria bacterium]|nr:hypothetical protein [Pseudomonadota bacterium]